MFVHLHVHSHYSILDGMATIPGLVDKALSLGMPALALTDHGNMFGIKEFLDYVKKKNKGLPDDRKIKPIVGCELYVARRTRHDRDKSVTDSRLPDLDDEQDDKQMIVDKSGEHLIALAKNKTGYHNLCKLVSLAWTEGFYQTARVDKELLEKYHEGLIICSACLGGEIHRKIQAKNLQGAEEAVLWFKRVFGDDYYIELQAHPTTKPGGRTDTYERQRVQNIELLNIARKTNTSIIVSNDVHFVEEEHADAHERLLCVSTQTTMSDPKRMRYTKQEWFKNEQEMRALFPDLPEAFENTVAIADKVEHYDITSEPIMPTFAIPQEFGTIEQYRTQFTEDALREEFGERFDKMGGYNKVLRIKLEADYLSHLAFEGAKERYGDGLTEEIKQRIRFELDVMKTMGFPGYFLIVRDFIQYAWSQDVWVGPGRGSAAGSVVAYCLRITNIDPLQYGLLFERFLNPDRVSLPDIDIDFDEGRSKVYDYIVQKYGEDSVAHIITFGTMATKSAIKDVARVLEMPIDNANRLANYIPFAFDKGKDGKAPKVNIANCIEYIPELNEAALSGNPQVKETLKYAQMLENTVRNRGVHACGVIIGPSALINYIPLCTAEEKGGKEKLLVTQYEGSIIEDVGLIKIDLLGLNTLSIIKDTIRNIKETKGKEVDIERIPLDDKKVYEMFGRGDTIGIFQFESAGMQKYLKELKPTQLGDIVAMNALYRPGPMEYIPTFIRRKHGEEPITYPLPEMEEVLKETYGVTVYQEQVMLLSRKLAGFTRGQSDELRKAMGKKIKEKLDKLKPQFLEGCKTNGHPANIVEKIWSDWEKFTEYAFNKSHAVGYSWLAYQTAYLKVHYPAEFLASALAHSLSSPDDIKKYMKECKALKIKVLVPNVNESNVSFTVNAQGDIRFGLAAIKGVGENVSEVIVDERAKKKFKDLFDFVERMGAKALNKRNVEALAGAGAFDGMGIDRPAFFVEHEKDTTFVDSLLRYAGALQREKDSGQQSLFGNEATQKMSTPKIPLVEEVNQLAMLNKEKEMLGVYLSSHPMTKYDDVVLAFANASMNELKNINDLVSKKNVVVAGKVSRVQQLTTKTGKPYGKITTEDESGTYEWFLFSKDYDIYYPKLVEGNYYMLTAAVQEKYQSKYATMGLSAEQQQKSKEYELRLNRIESLDEIKKRGLKSITLTIQVSKINEEFIAELEAFSAKDGIDLIIILQGEGMQIESKAHRTKVAFGETLTDFLKEQEIQYQVR